MSSTFLFAKITWVYVLLWFDFFMSPSLSLMGVMIGTVVLDLITGIIKAKFLGQARTSTGLRRTVIKISQYAVPVLVFWVAGKFIPEYKVRLQQAGGFLMMFIVYIECTSIFENLYAIDQKTPISKYIYKPALIILKFGIEHNPVAEAAEKITKQTITTEVKTKEKIVTEIVPTDTVNN